MNKLRHMIIFPILLIATSIVCGLASYSKAKDDMTADLNQALQLTLSSNESMKSVLDSLSHLPNSPMLTFDGRHHGFANLLNISSLRDTATITYSVKDDSNQIYESNTYARICSDTLLLVQSPNTAIEIKAYSNPSIASILKYSNQGWSALSLVSGLILLCLFVLANRSQQHASITTSITTNHEYTQELCLTPMQNKLMQMFLENPYHTLRKDEICSALWPKKDNPDDTLYTFISRMKSSLAKQSSYRIKNHRHKEYSLTIEE